MNSEVVDISNSARKTPRKTVWPRSKNTAVRSSGLILSILDMLEITDIILFVYGIFYLDRYRGILIKISLRCKMELYRAGLTII